MESYQNFEYLRHIKTLFLAVRPQMDGSPIYEQTFGITMFFDVPDGILVSEHFIGDHLVLVEAPGRQLPPAEAQRGARVHVDQPHERPDAVPRGVLAVPIYDVHPPEVLSRHRYVVVDVAGNFLEKEHENV